MITSEKLNILVITMGIILNMFVFGMITSGPSQDHSNLPEIARISGCRG